VGKTHPVFYVGLNGDIHFLSNSRMEYALYKFQQAKAGRLGLNPWMFRGYLSPPTAPEKVRSWARRKVIEWERMKPAWHPGLKPQPVPASAYSGIAAVSMYNARNSHTIRRR